LYNSIDLNRF